MTQRDDYVAWLLSHVGWAYCNEGPWRCTGERHCYDCSGFDCAGMRAVGLPYPCSNSELMADDLVAHGRTCTREVARATKGAWVIRRFANPVMPGQGHIGVSLGDGRIVEAHSHADGIVIGPFDGRSWQTFGLPPGMAGFDIPPSPNPGPGTVSEAKAMGMTAAIRVPGSRQQKKAPWLNRYPMIGAIVQPDGHTDVVGFNGAEIWGGSPHVGMHIFRLPVLRAPIESFSHVDDDPNVQAHPGHAIIVGMAGDGGTFIFDVAGHYI